MSQQLAFVAVVCGMVLMGISARAEEKVKPEVTEGYIHSVDAGANSFVLGGKNESQTTFKVNQRADALTSGKIFGGWASLTAADAARR